MASADADPFTFTRLPADIPETPIGDALLVQWLNEHDGRMPGEMPLSAHDARSIKRTAKASKRAIRTITRVPRTRQPGQVQVTPVTLPEADIDWQIKFDLLPPQKRF